MPVTIVREGCTPECTCTEREKRRQLKECASFKDEWHFNDYYNIVVSKHSMLCKIFDEIHNVHGSEDENKNEKENENGTSALYKTTEVLIIRGPWARNKNFLYTFTNRNSSELEDIIDKMIIKDGGYERLSSILAKEAPPLKSFDPKIDRVLEPDRFPTNQKTYPNLHING
ncbi:hypothetical protein NCAS_0F01700 [Naumovozyma castellii]|uniref:Uncharacterized protein n=1 Tax=Naumovozyma castellii TaxID=27288 RepID=G0VGN3_NAUCA|nr:hypothetical protein NCAS_0F01700 [Naumovozyma castellii CBS 4309]CCC70654.1 hypothetical protein NCAS_0F01700 [Naumovozyma castellii CBS 4309]